MSKKITFIVIFALIVIAIYNLWDFTMTTLVFDEAFKLNPMTNIAIPLVVGVVVANLTYDRRNR